MDSLYDRRLYDQNNGYYIQDIKIFLLLILCLLFPSLLTIRLEYNLKSLQFRVSSLYRSSFKDILLILKNDATLLD